MFKKILPQIIASLFLAGFVAYAWTEPPSAPPVGNVPAPINVGTAPQAKSGPLLIGGIFQAFSDAIFNGKVGIGTASPSQSLDIVSNSGDSAIHFGAPGGTVFTNTFNYVGGLQPFIVPPTVTQITVDARGAQGGGGGGSADGSGGVGGKGARIYNTSFAVTGGETLYIYVGGGVTMVGGGFNGGGEPGLASSCGDGDCNATNGGGGGGATDVRKGGNALSNRVVVAGGGGGGGGATWACGSGTSGGAGGSGGQNGNNGLPGTGGKGGTQLAGGAGGTGNSSPQSGSIGQGGFGGAGYGNTDTSFCNRGGAGGGGGGGYYGGGGGASNMGGGGGGSSLVPAGASVSSDFQTGNGQVIITYTANMENWTIGIDQSDSGKFKISRRTNSLGTNDVLTIDLDTGMISGSFGPQSQGLYGYCREWSPIALPPAFLGAPPVLCRCPLGYETVITGFHPFGGEKMISCYKR